MYYKKMESILDDIEDKNVEIAGGSVVNVVLSTINSLIIYISNLTLNKKKYEDVESEVRKVLSEANLLKNKALKSIDGDKEILEKILESYKLRNEEPNKYISVCKDSVKFCESVLLIAFDTLKLSDKISKIGNKMLSSDFKICKYYSYASVKSAIVNIDINLSSIDDEKYKNEVIKNYNKILEESDKYIGD